MVAAKGNQDGKRKEARQAAALRRETVTPTPKTKGRIIRLVRGGCTLTEVCKRSDMPSYTTLFEWRKHDPEFDAEVCDALMGLAEYVINEGTDMAREVTDKEMSDTDRSRVVQAYSECAFKFAAAIAPRKYGVLSKIAGEGGEGIALHVVTYASPINPGEAANNTRVRDNAATATPPRPSAVDGGTSPSPRSSGNGRTGRGDKGRTRGRKVQPNPRTIRKAKRAKA